MTLDFEIKDIVHRIAVKFIPAFLPGASKPYYLKAARQPELDIRGIASMANMYNITTNPKVIEEGLKAGMELIYYLAADGYRIKTPVFKLKMRIPGEYKGSETSLAEGIFPVARLQIAAELRKYLKDKVKLEFDGIEQNEGHIAEAQDDATGLIDQVLTPGNILTIRGYGLKVESDPEHECQAGVFFNPQTGVPVKASVIALNEPKTLKVLVPNELVPGMSYKLAVGTMSSVKGNGILTKSIRDIRSEFSLVA